MPTKRKGICFSTGIGPPLSEVGFRGATKEGSRNGDLTFKGCFPVIYGSSWDEEPQWEPLPCKTLKELKLACPDYGPTSPYTLTIVEAVANQWMMTPYDWMQTAKSCLKGGDYLLWKSEYEDLARKEALKNIKRERLIPYLC